jgi:hypothetical protein
LVVLDLDHGGATQDLKQDSHSFGGHALDETFDVAQCCMQQTHCLTGFEVADFLQSGLAAVLLQLAYALHQCVWHDSRLKPKPDDGGDAFGAADGRDALFGFAWPEKNVAWKHGFKQGNRALRRGIELFV